MDLTVSPETLLNIPDHMLLITQMTTIKHNIS